MIPVLAEQVTVHSPVTRFAMHGNAALVPPSDTTIIDVTRFAMHGNAASVPPSDTTIIDVTRFAMHGNAADAVFRAAILGISEHSPENHLAG